MINIGITPLLKNWGDEKVSEASKNVASTMWYYPEKNHPLKIVLDSIVGQALSKDTIFKSTLKSHISEVIQYRSEEVHNYGFYRGVTVSFVSLAALCFLGGLAFKISPQVFSALLNTNVNNIGIYTDYLKTFGLIITGLARFVHAHCNSIQANFEKIDSINRNLNLF